MQEQALEKTSFSQASLAEKVRRRPCVWNFTAKTHADKVKTAKAWVEIAQSFIEVKRATECKQEWEKMKDTRRKRKQREKAKSRSGSAGGSEGTNFAADYMSFLDDVGRDAGNTRVHTVRLAPPAQPDQDDFDDLDLFGEAEEAGAAAGVQPRGLRLAPNGRPFPSSSIYFAAGSAPGGGPRGGGDELPVANCSAAAHAQWERLQEEANLRPPPQNANAPQGHPSTSAASDGRGNQGQQVPTGASPGARERYDRGRWRNPVGPGTPSSAAGTSVRASPSLISSARRGLLQQSPAPVVDDGGCVQDGTPRRSRSGRPVRPATRWSPLMDRPRTRSRSRQGRASDDESGAESDASQGPARSGRGRGRPTGRRGGNGELQAIPEEVNHGPVEQSGREDDDLAAPLLEDVPDEPDPLEVLAGQAANQRAAAGNQQPPANQRPPGNLQPPGNQQPPPPGPRLNRQQRQEARDAEARAVQLQHEQRRLGLRANIAQQVEARQEAQRVQHQQQQHQNRNRGRQPERDFMREGDGEIELLREFLHEKEMDVYGHFGQTVGCLLRAKPAPESGRLMKDILALLTAPEP